MEKAKQEDSFLLKRFNLDVNLKKYSRIVVRLMRFLEAFL